MRLPRVNENKISGGNIFNRDNYGSEGSHELDNDKKALF